MTTTTELEYEVARQMRIDRQDVLESSPTYIKRIVEHFLDKQRALFLKDIDDCQDIVELKARYE